MPASDVLDGGGWVTDGGLETDLVFHHGIDLPEFASFPLLHDERGIGLLRSYYGEYSSIAAAAGVGLLVETPTWRANPDWATTLGLGPAELDRANRAAVALAHEVAGASPVERTRISGVVGPRGDGYVAARTEVDEAADYHAPQVSVFAAEGADLVHAMTMTGPAEAAGVVRAARAARIPVAISFTVETDGRLPDGRTLSEAIDTLESTDPADWYGVNCAHPSHLAAGLDGGSWQEKVSFLRPNASTLSHAELDAMEVLDDGDPALLTGATDAIRSQLPALRVVGGCCGTDSRHVAALWGVPAPR
ncbi:homocysteine S-methyltransferase family protein [Aeromicrobium sp. YC3-14]|nr:homocysteine S-methyltransferase family protein [Aeromicrobium stalagmiti]